MKYQLYTYASLQKLESGKFNVPFFPYIYIYPFKSVERAETENFSFFSKFMRHNSVKYHWPKPNSNFEPVYF